MSETRSHTRSVVLPTDVEQVFALLHTPSAICEWWQASNAIVVPQPGGVWCATWGDPDDPDYISAAIMREFNPPRRIVMSDFQYVTKQGGELPFDFSQLATTFEIEPHSDGAKLTVTQSGFPTDSVADDFYHACETGWERTFNGIVNYVKQQRAISA